MKTNNVLSEPKANKLGPIFKFDWLPANLPTLASAAIIFAIAVMALQIWQKTTRPENQSLAWYMANPQEALAANKTCFDNPQLQTSEKCVNSLHALDIMHKGPNS
jgi:hypothetical protein